MVPLLEAAGHTALAPDLIGMGGDAAPDNPPTIGDWADQIAGLLEAQIEAVILVGHSRGGVVISEAAERVPDRIACLVYLTALLLVNGQTMDEALSPPPGTQRTRIIETAGDGWIAVKPEHVLGHFYNRTAPEWAERAQSLLRPEPVFSFLTPVMLTPERFGRVPRAYIECTDDNAISLSAQRAMQARLPCDPVITMDADHSPFYSDPEGLARALLSLA